MKSTIFLAVSLFVLIFLCQSDVYGQGSKPTTTPTPTPFVRKPLTKGEILAQKIKPHLPDLVVSSPFYLTYDADANGNFMGIFHVDVDNLGDPRVPDTDVTKPFKVWLRVWKPADPKGAESPTSGKTSYLWGGVVIVKELKAGKGRGVEFLVTNTPPGGWNIKCQLLGCVRDPASLKHPLHWRVTVQVDSSNDIKESNEANNEKP